MARIKLTQKDILEKEFKNERNGYSQKEVDDFLDLIISDYKVFNDEVSRLFKENERLRKQNSQIAKTPPANFGATASIGSTTTAELLKRVSNLEKAVFGKQY